MFIVLNDISLGNRYNLKDFLEIKIFLFYEIFLCISIYTHTYIHIFVHICKYGFYDHFLSVQIEL